MMKTVSAGIALTVLVSALGCSSERKPGLTITGASTLAPLVAEIGKRFEEEHPGVRIDVQSGGSSRGIADVALGLADIGMSSRPLLESEKTGRKSYALARDGVAFVVHKDNNVRSLTRQQIRDIYTGRITNWEEVGGGEGPITVINRAAGRSELQLFSQLFRLKPSDIRPSLIAGENQQGLKMVCGDPNAIIYISLGAAQHEAEHGAPIKLLPFEGVEATVHNVRSGKYSFTRPLVLITRADPPPLVERFVAFALSEKVHDLVQEFDFVPIH